MPRSVITIHWSRLMPLRDLIGQRFGRLVVVSRASNQGRQTRWSCACDCGGRKVAQSSNLVRGLTASCGCLHREKSSSAVRTHGKTGTPEFISWMQMRARCSNPRLRSYPRYGGRGITICDQWAHSFESFLADMGPRPTPRHSIDRIDVDGPYSPENCRWATTAEQARNTSTNRIVVVDDIAAPLIEHCERRGIDYKRAHRRLVLGWSIERALSTNPLTTTE